MDKLLYTTPEISIVMVENDILATGLSSEKDGGEYDWA